MVLFDVDATCPQCDTYFKSIGRHWILSKECSLGYNEEYMKELIIQQNRERENERESMNRSITVEKTVQAEIQQW